MKRFHFWLLVPPFVILFGWFLREDIRTQIVDLGEDRRVLIFVLCAALLLLQIAVLVYLKRRARRRTREDD